MKIAHISVLAALVVASQVAFAQAPVNPGSSASISPSTTTTTTTTGAAGDAGSVSNVGSITASTDTSSIDTTLPDESGTNSNHKGELANTGGEPQLMLMAGLVLAACGLLLRRKAAGQAI